MTTIEWTTPPGTTKGETWNPTVGCSRVSPGCENCYAEKIAHRGMSPQHKGLTVLGKHGVRWNGKINLVPSALEKPLRWRKPRGVFVDSMSDLFHPGVPFEYIAIVFGVMGARPQHTFQILTKRPERMVDFFQWFPGHIKGPRHVPSYATKFLQEQVAAAPSTVWPLPNVWLGVSVEDQKRTHRILDLVRCPAAVRFLSVEPMLESVDLGLAGMLRRRRSYLPLSTMLHWVICGGESGGGARPFDVQWATDLLKQCQEHDVPFFMKQLGAKPNLSGPQRSRKGGDPAEWPPHLRVRQWPQVESL